MAILDDDLLLSVLAGEGTSDLRRGVYTDGCWYYRLARAVYDVRVAGALSSSLSSFSPEGQLKVVAALDDLPEWVGLVSWRRLVPVMRRIDPALQLIMLATEAVAMAVVTEAAIRVRTDNPFLARAAVSLGIDYAVVTEI